MSYPRQHHTTCRPKVWTAKSVLVCVFVIALLLVAVCNPSIFKGLV
jgi:hypothetical protein